MWRTVFLTGWCGCLGFVAACWRQWQAAFAHSENGLWVLSLTIAVLPWAAGPGLLPVLGRMDRGGINLPHADHWFTGARRAASLQRLAPFMYAMGLMLALFLCALLALELRNGLQGRALPDGELLVATAVFLALTALWVLALLRAFPKPPADALAHRGKP